MTDTDDLPPPGGSEAAHSVARALAGTGRPVAIVQTAEGGPVDWYVHDARYADGWRPVTDQDELARLVEDINAHQASVAEPGPGEVEVPEGAALVGGAAPGRPVDPITGVPVADSTTSNVDLGDGTTPEDSTGGGADDPEGDAPGGEATPTAGTGGGDDG